MAFSNEIMGWYQRHKRDLPWRHTRDAYVIWLSEIILQQTRVEQGLPYFYRFLAHYPDVAAFAAATEDELLRDWQGLGYYSRVRNMHQAARTVVEGHGGVFPQRYSELIKLKGVGEYTAAAIASFAAGEAKAVVDGNVFRVLARYFGIDTPINSSGGKRRFLELAQDLLDPHSPGLYNQAIMEFGALQCKPQNPDCASCVLRIDCRALSEKRVGQLPVKIKAKPSRDRYFNYFVVTDGDYILMNKRQAGDIWAHLYELPLIETPRMMEVHELANSDAVLTHFGEGASLRHLAGPVKHVLSHQNVFARFIGVQLASRLQDHSGQGKKINWHYVFTKDIATLAKPKLIYSFLKDYGIE